MGMQMIDKVLKELGITSYNLANKWLPERGVKVTVQGIDAYRKPGIRSMRLDVLCAIADVVGWEKVGRWLSEDFPSQKQKKK